MVGFAQQMVHKKRFHDFAEAGYPAVVRASVPCTKENYLKWCNATGSVFLSSEENFRSHFRQVPPQKMVYLCSHSTRACNAIIYFQKIEYPQLRELKWNPIQFDVPCASFSMPTPATKPDWAWNETTIEIICGLSLAYTVRNNAHKGLFVAEQI